MLDKNKQLVRRLFEEVINQGNMAVADQIMAEDYVERSTLPGLKSGREGFKQLLSMIANAFPDISVTVEEMIAEGDKVTVRLTISGTHKGTLLGNIPATGKKAHWTGVDIFRIQDGRIVERWSERDLLGLMQQLGVVSK